MSEFFAELYKIPPVTRFLCASTLAVSIPVMMQLIHPYKVLFIWRFVVDRWQIWRPFTSFFLASSGINFIFDLIMLYRTSDNVESTHFGGRSPDYAWQVFLASCAVMGATTPLRSSVHFRALLLALITLQSKLSSPGAQTSLMGFISVPVQYLPYALVGLDLVMGGPRAAGEAVAGVIVGWGWWMMVWGQGAGRGVGTAPSWVRRFVASGPSVGAIGGVHVIPPRTTRSGSGGSGSGGGYRWGSGQRLGND